MGRVNFSEVAKTSPGFQFNKYDMERLGVFTFPGSLRGMFVPRGQGGLVYKGRQMMSVFPKWKCGTQDGYFDNTFRRIFIKEAIYIKPKKKAPKEGAPQPFCNPHLVPMCPTKKHSTPGDSYGCFHKHTHMENKFRKKKPTKHEMANAQIAAPGYFHKFPTYMPNGVPKKRKPNKKQLKQPSMVLGHYGNPYFWLNPYDEGYPTKPVYIQPKEKKNKNPIIRPRWHPFAPGKLMGHDKSGGFSTWPKFKPTKYWPPAKKFNDGREYYTHSYAAKSMYTSSIMQRNVDLKTNVKNFNTQKPQYVSRYVVEEKL